MDKDLLTLLLRLLGNPGPSIRGEVLEQLVCQLFCRLPGWKAEITNHTNSKDHGIDVIATSPTGKRLAIQCKNWDRPAGPPEVSRIYTAKDYRDAHKAILVCPSGFTKQAIEEGRKIGVLLWGLDELVELYEAASSERARKKLDLEEPKPNPWTPWLAQLRQRVRRPLLAGGVGLAILLVLLALAAMPKASPKAQKTEDEVIRVVTQYDQAFRGALATNAYAPLYRWAFASFLDRKVVPFIEERKRRNCVLLTYVLAPMVITSISFDDINAEVKTSKNWRQILRCKGAPDREVLNRPFSTSYLLRYDGNQLKIFDSEGN